MKMTIVNLEAGMPTVEVTRARLSQSLRTARACGTRVVKVIHGYGSTGKGGAIRSAVRRDLEERRRQGQIRLFVPGDEFSPFYEDARQAVCLFPELAKDRDYARTNQGITIVVL